jgi:hypothetical protein
MTPADHRTTPADGLPPSRAWRALERVLLARRAGTPDVAGAVETALAAAWGGPPPADLPAARAARMIAAAVEHDGAVRAAVGREPAYHGRHHQAEATLVMGWLAGTARRLGQMRPDDAVLCVAAMAAHDLGHPGRDDGPRGALKAQSADLGGRIAAASGLSADDVRRLRAVVLSTTWPWLPDEEAGFAGRLAREADVFGLAMPTLGRRLGRLLAQEQAAAGQAEAAEALVSRDGRRRFLHLLGPGSPPAKVLGRDHAIALQLRRLSRQPGPSPRATAETSPEHA